MTRAPSGVRKVCAMTARQLHRRQSTRNGTPDATWMKTMRTAVTRTVLQAASTRPVKVSAGTWEMGLTSKERSVVAREKRMKTAASRRESSVTATSRAPHGVHGAEVSLRIHVLMVSGSSGDRGAQLRGNSNQRRLVMKKVVTCRARNWCWRRRSRFKGNTDISRAGLHHFANVSSKTEANTVPEWLRVFGES